jgi:molybdate transport system ATP-binding protein
VLVALRPSAISLHTERPGHSSPRNIWPGRIQGLELLTDRVRVEVHGTPSALVDLTPDAVAELDLAFGTEVWLSAKATDVDVYPDTDAKAEANGDRVLKANGAIERPRPDDAR